MTELSYPSPEEIAMLNETILQQYQDTMDKMNFVVDLVFKQRNIFNAWYQNQVLSQAIAKIARTEQQTPKIIRRRIAVAQDIVTNFQKTLHKIDD